VTDRDRSHESKSKITHLDVRRRLPFITREQASKRQEREISKVVQISFLPMVQIFSRLSLCFLHSKWVPHSCNCLSFCAITSLQISRSSSLRPSVRLALFPCSLARPSLTLFFVLSGETCRQSHFLVLKQTKHNEIVLKIIRI